MMFVVALVFESRKIYLGKGQSRMFFPGDLSIGVALTMIIGMYARNPITWEFIHTVAYWIVTAIIHAIIAIFANSIDTKRYPKRSKYSPTRIAHLIFGYFLGIWLIVASAVPQLIWSIATRSFDKCPLEWIIGWSSAGFFAVMTIWDVTHPASDKDLLLMHPDDWKPCWK